MADNYYVIGNDKTLKEGITLEELVETLATYLPLAGGYMTGDIGYSSGSRNGYPIRFISGDANGSGIAIGDGGTVVIGAGESSRAYQPAAGSGNTEQLILASDNSIVFYVNADSTANAIQVTLSKSTGLLSGHQKAISSGTAAPSGGSNGDIYIQY